MASKKEHRELVRLAKTLGWKIRETRDGWLLTHPSGPVTALHRNLGGPNNIRNIRAEITRPAKGRA
jgi:hypothetical protein